MVKSEIKLFEKFCALKDDQLFLGTRSTGTELGKEIFEKLNSGENIEINFEGVDSVTQSFIDEILGVNFRYFGATIIKKMKFTSCNDEIIKTIKFVYHYSKDMIEQRQA